ncbi:flagellar protein FlgN [Clostridium sp. DL1XJH146]
MSIYHLYSKEEEILHNLKSVLIKEKELLINGKWQELNKIVEEKTKISERLGQLESKRLAADEKVLLDELTDDLKEKSLIIKNNIRELIIDIQIQNETNTLLTKSSLRYTKEVLGSLGVGNKTNTYGANGKVGQATRNINVSINKSV